MVLIKNGQTRSTPHYWGYRELSADELLVVGGGEDGGGGADGGAGDSGDAGDSGASDGTSADASCSPGTAGCAPSTGQAAGAGFTAFGLTVGAIGVAVAATPVGAAIGAGALFGASASSVATNPAFGSTTSTPSDPGAIGNPLGDLSNFSGGW